jgi:tetratricopeptide (TPR) repeat protein
MSKRYLIYLFMLQAMLVLSCKKGDFLAENPDQSLAIPTSIKDCQALLDNDLVMNGYGNAGYPNLGLIGSDDYYVTAQQFSLYALTDQHAVVWAKQIYTEEEVNDWDLPYRTVLYANVAIQALDALRPAQEQQTTWNNVRGSAFFFRAYAYHQLAQIFIPVYDSSKAAADPGLPLRQGTDVNERFQRASVQQTYDQMITDLAAAIPLLPDTSLYPTRPCKAAAYGLLSRIYLSAGAYGAALRYADTCLQLRPELLDYNTLDASNPLPFTRSKPEVIFGAANFSSGPLNIGRSLTDSLLFGSYQPADLRKALFFKSGRYFFGRYDEEGFAFSGIATDEVYLNRAECYARAGDIASAMADLNHLLITRWESGSFTPVVAADAAEALQIILMERRKELLYRGLRWADLRRLNKQPATAITLIRVVNGQTYTLPPNDLRYVYPIPDKVLALNPKIVQNPR